MVLLKLTIREYLVIFFTFGLDLFQHQCVCAYSITVGGDLH